MYALLFLNLTAVCTFYNYFRQKYFLFYFRLKIYVAYTYPNIRDH